MSTMTMCMSDEDATLVRKLANFKDVTISNFAHIAILEKIEDSYDLHGLRAAIVADNGQRSSIDEVLEELRRCYPPPMDTASNPYLEPTGSSRR